MAGIFDGHFPAGSGPDPQIERIAAIVKGPNKPLSTMSDLIAFETVADIEISDLFDQRRSLKKKIKKIDDQVERLYEAKSRENFLYRERRAKEQEEEERKRRMQEPVAKKLYKYKTSRRT